MTGSDLSPTLVEAAQRRAQEHGLDLTLEVADCQDLHYADASFDVVSSSVGVIFAPDHERVASELARVCRPGGRIGLTAWRRDERRRRDVRRDGAVHARTAARRRLAVPVGRRGLRRVDARQTCSTSRSRSSTRRHEGEHGGEMWEIFRDNFGPVVHPVDVPRRGAACRSRRGDGGVLRGLPHGRRRSASSAATSSSPAFASRLIAARSYSSSRYPLPQTFITYGSSAPAARSLLRSRDACESTVRVTSRPR